MGDMWTWLGNTAKQSRRAADVFDAIIPGELDGVTYEDGVAYRNRGDGSKILGAGGSDGWWFGADEFYKDAKYKPSKKKAAAPTAAAVAGPQGGGGLFGALLPDSWEDKLAGMFAGMAAGAQPEAPGPFDQIGKPPPVNIRSMSELMRDPALGRVADQNIIMANAAIGRENRDRRQQMMRDTTSLRRAGDHAEQQIGQVAHQNRKATEAIEKRHDAEQASQQTAVDDVIRNIALNMVNNDTVSEGLQAGQAQDRQERRDRQEADDELMSGLASSGQDAIMQMQAAQPMQTAADIGKVREEAMQEVQTNRRKAADNWFGRSAILAELAAQEQAADQQRAALGLDRYKTEATILDSWASAQAKQAEAMAGAGGGAGGDPLERLSGIASFMNSMYTPVNTIERTDDEGNKVMQNDFRVNYMPPEWIDYYNQTLMPHYAQQGFVMPPLQQIPVK